MRGISLTTCVVGISRASVVMDNNADFLFRPFGDIYKKAIDEIWYKRAVEHYYINRLSFVYSVPFDVGFSSETLVTASRAVFHHDKQGNKAPAAVVGYQFRHSALSTLFFDTVSAVNFYIYFKKHASRKTLKFFSSVSVPSCRMFYHVRLRRSRLFCFGQQRIYHRFRKL